MGKQDTPSLNIQYGLIMVKFFSCEDKCYSPLIQNNTILTAEKKNLEGCDIAPGSLIKRIINSKATECAPFQKRKKKSSYTTLTVCFRVERFALNTSQIIANIWAKRQVRSQVIDTNNKVSGESEIYASCMQSRYLIRATTVRLCARMYRNAKWISGVLTTKPVNYKGCTYFTGKRETIQLSLM